TVARTPPVPSTAKAVTPRVAPQATRADPRAVNRAGLDTAAHATRTPRPTGQNRAPRWRAGSNAHHVNEASDNSSTMGTSPLGHRIATQRNVTITTADCTSTATIQSSATGESAGTSPKPAAATVA